MNRYRVLLVAITFLALIPLALLFTPANGDTKPNNDFLPTGNVAVNPAGVDLDVTYINRSPLYKSYCVDYLYDAPNQPGRPFLCAGTQNDQRWPAEGEVVTFTAHIINKGDLVSPAFEYAWYIDDTEQITGTLPALDPGSAITTTYQWTWAHQLSQDGQRALGDHTVRFSADPDNNISEAFETNNSLEDATRAMSFSIYITPEMYAAYNVALDPKYPNSAEDWLQRQIATMNALFASASYPITPNGSPLRVRINLIDVKEIDPGPDGQHDGGWFIRDDVRCSDCEVDIDWGLIHELSHQVSLIDLYAIGVYASNVFIKDQNGHPVNVGFGWSNMGIMGGGDISPYTDQERYSSHSAGGSATFSGYRNGYYGSYLYDIPLQNDLQILDNQGMPAQGVQVTIYQRGGPWDWTGQMGVDNTPEITGTTDASGGFTLPNRPANGGVVTQNGHVMHDNPFGVVDIIGNQGLFLVQLSKGGHEEFHWMDITQFNLAYWSGDTLSHTFTISSHVPAAGAPTAPTGLQARVEGSWVGLNWEPSPSQEVVGYHVYRATPPRYQYLPAGELVSGTHFEETFWGNYNDGLHRLYAITAVSGSGLESGFSELIYVPGLDSPESVVLSPDGSWVVLNRGNLYPLLKLWSDGRYTHRLVNVHYNLWDSHFLTFDAANRILVSGFGDFPGNYSAVRLYDQEMTPLVSFGEEGSDPGQFLAPSGIGTWGEACTFGGPYQDDDQTTLLLHFNGDYLGTQGEPGIAVGTGFTDGNFGQGVLMDETDTLTYQAADNLSHTLGAVEFWFRPNWDGDDGGDHAFFWWDDQGGRFHLRKDAISNLVFDYFYSGGGCGAPINVADWKAGQWHHLTFTWEGTEIRLYVDGKLVAKSICEGTAQPTADEFSIGSFPDGSSSIDGIIDELRISTIPRIGNSDSCNRILIADSENHRIQAFSSLGDFITAYGSLGNGLGQFDHPQGLVVDARGQVIVADQDNNRLVILGFDGQDFSLVGSLTPGLNAPSGLALDDQGNLYVADTGNNRILVLDPDGNPVTSYTGPNDSYTGTFNAPRGVAVDPGGYIIVADTGNRRVVTVRMLAKAIFFPLLLR